MTGTELRELLLMLHPTGSMHWRMRAAAKSLGIARSGLYRLCNKSRVPRVYELAAERLRQRHAMVSYRDALRRLKAEAREMASDIQPEGTPS